MIGYFPNSYYDGVRLLLKFSLIILLIIIVQICVGKIVVGYILTAKCVH